MTTKLASDQYISKLEESAADYGVVGDGITNDTTALQLAMDTSYANQNNLFVPSGTYLVTGLVVPGLVDGMGIDDRNKGWRMFGQGFGEPFVTLNTGGTNIVSVTDAPVLQDQEGTIKSSNGTIEIDHIRFDGTSTTPVVSFKSQYGVSSFHHFAIHQRGVGDGFKTFYAPTVSIHEGYSMNKDFVSVGLGAARVGIGFNIAPEHDGALFTISKCTARGFLTGFALGGTANNFSTKITDSEASTVFNGITVAATSKGTVLDTLYLEGGEGGMGVLDAGDSTTIRDNYIGAGFLTGIDATSIVAKGTVITGNTVANGGLVNGTCIDVVSSAVFGGYNKTVNNNYIPFSDGTAGVTGIRIAGTDPRLSVFNNSFDPKTAWSGAGSNKIVDNSVNGVYGITTAIDGSFEYPILSKGSVVLHKNSTALTQSDVAANVLTIPDNGSYFVVSATGAATVNSLSAGVNEARLITFRTTTADMTFADTSFIFSSGAFTGPGTITFLVEWSGSANFAYEVSRTSF